MEALRPLTIKDLAAKLGVSSMTVHRAIAGKPDVSAETRARILAEVERYGWRPNIAARGLRQQKTFTLGILVSNVAASFLPEVLQGVNQTADAEGYHTIVSVHDHDPARAERHLRTLQSKGVDGIVYYPTLAATEGPLVSEIHESTPVVAVMRRLPDFAGPCILVDDNLGGRMATAHLLELGHTHIGFLGYAKYEFSTYRRAGYEAALREAGLAPRPEWVVTNLVRYPQVEEEAARILRLSHRPTALFCASDRLAAHALRAAAELRIRVPEELSLIGYNCDAWSELLAVPLTTLAQPRAEVGTRAAQMLLSGEGAIGERARIILAPSLVERASTAPPRQQYQ